MIVNEDFYWWIVLTEDWLILIMPQMWKEDVRLLYIDDEDKKIQTYQPSD